MVMAAQTVRWGRAPTPSCAIDDDCNRLVEVYNYSGGGPRTFGEYVYDGLHRRIAKIVPDDPEDPDDYIRTDYYYTFDWQAFEERVDTRDTLSAARSTPSTTVTYQYLWDPRYIDAPICRDEDQSDGSGGNPNGLCTDDATGIQGSNNGDEHLYYCQDGNYNTTSLVDSYDGAVVERYQYDPYGEVTVLHGVRDSSGSSTTEWNQRTSNTFANEIL
jgi:hypothetical protein